MKVTIKEKLQFVVFYFIIFASFSAYSQGVTKINLKFIQREFVREKVITKAQSKQIDRLYADKMNAVEKITRKETIELFLNATQENASKPYDSPVQLQEIEELVNYALNDTTDVFKGDNFTIPLPNTFGSYWIAVDRKHLVQRQKQYGRALDLFNKHSLLTSSEKETISNQLKNKVLMFDASFYKLCIEKIKE